MDDQLLIKLVERNELLYNKYNKDYKSIEKKEAAWKRIAKELGVSEEDCTRRWSVIRDRYTKESRRMAALANNGMTATRFWPLFFELDFLKTHIVQRRTRIVGSSSYSVDIKDQPTENSFASFVSENGDDAQQYEYITENNNQSKDSTADQDGEQQEVEEEMVQEHIEALEDSDSPSYRHYEGINPLQHEQPKVMHKISTSQRNNRKRHYESDTESVNELTSALGTFKKWCGTTRSRHRNPAVHGFGQMIVETICGMSERKQAIAMQKVTEIVMNLKMEPDNVV